MILVGDPLNPELNLYLPLDVTGCGVRSKYLQPLVFSLGPNSLKDPRVTCSTAEFISSSFSPKKTEVEVWVADESGTLPSDFDPRKRQ